MEPAATPRTAAKSDDATLSSLQPIPYSVTRRGPGARLAKRQGSRQDAPRWKAGACGARFEGQWYSRRARLRKLRGTQARLSLHCAPKQEAAPSGICWPARLPDGTRALARKALNACRAVSRGGFTAGVGAASLPIDGHRVCSSWAATQGHCAARASFFLCHQVPRLSPHRAGR